MINNYVRISDYDADASLQLCVWRNSSIFNPRCSNILYRNPYWGRHIIISSIGMLWCTQNYCVARSQETEKMSNGVWNANQSPRALKGSEGHFNLWVIFSEVASQTTAIAVLGFITIYRNRIDIKCHIFSTFPWQRLQVENRSKSELFL